MLGLTRFPLNPKFASATTRGKGRIRNTCLVENFLGGLLQPSKRLRRRDWTGSVTS